MTRALISLASEDPDTGGAIGLAPLFDGQIIDYQIAAAEKLGATSFVLISPTMAGALLRYTDDLKRRGMTVELVRHAGDLVQYAESSGSILFLGDAVIPQLSVLNLLGQGEQEEILVVSAGQGDDQFERIDLNHRWVGVARFAAERLAGLADIPDDWDVGSALLRVAVQADLSRRLISDEEMVVGSIAKLPDDVTAATHVRQRLDALSSDKRNFLDRFLIWPLTRRLLPKLWSRPQIGSYLRAGAWFIGGISAVVGGLYSPFWALSLLLIAIFLQDLMNRTVLFSVRKRKTDRTNILFNLLAVTAFLVVVYRSADAMSVWTQLTIGLLLAAILWLIYRKSPDVRFSLFRPDKMLILIVLMFFSGFGYLPLGLALSALASMAYLIANVEPWKSRESADFEQS